MGNVTTNKEPVGFGTIVQVGYGCALKAAVIFLVLVSALVVFLDAIVRSFGVLLDVSLAVGVVGVFLVCAVDVPGVGPVHLVGVDHLECHDRGHRDRDYYQQECCNCGADRGLPFLALDDESGNGQDQRCKDARPGDDQGGLEECQDYADYRHRDADDASGVAFFLSFWLPILLARVGWPSLPRGLVVARLWLPVSLG